MARGITVTYGAVRAVDGIDLDVYAGQLIGLIGPNGAGKTSLIDAVTGFTPYGGELAVGGRSMDGLAPHQRARQGLRRTWQSLELFDDLTVRENVQVSLGRSDRRDRLRVGSMVDDVLSLLDLQDVANRRPDQLPQGLRKLVGVARAVVAVPAIIAMDEPAAGLDNDESRRLGVTLRGLVSQGMSILLVDHDMDLVLTVCDYIYVVDFGRVIAHGSPSSINRHPAVLAAYLGAAHNQRDEANDGVNPPVTEEGKIVGNLRPKAAALSALTAQTTVILAEHSKVHDSHRTAEKIRTTMPAATTIILPGATHHTLPMSPAPALNTALTTAFD